MDLAFLFDADNPSLGLWYGFTVMKHIIGTGVLQAVKRPMRVSIGDITTFLSVSGNGGSIADLRALNEKVYHSNDLDLIFRDELNETNAKGTVYCWLFQNITKGISRDMHAKLSHYPSYLGAMAVDFSYEPHLVFFRNSLIEKYRFSGTKVSEFFHMGNDEDRDGEIKEEFEKNGFSITYENAGARRTIFDNYDSIEHFRRVVEFRDVFSHIDGITADDASSITLSLEELHPQLFDVFAAAARALCRAETEEDLAQAALSGRRLLERLADYLYPPRDTEVGGRKVGKSQYKNRLWAYIEQVVSEICPYDNIRKLKLGQKTDHLVSLFNEGLHADVTRQKVEGAFRDLVIWLSDLIELSPEHARKPYLSYQGELNNYMEKYTKSE